MTLEKQRRKMGKEKRRIGIACVWLGGYLMSFIFKSPPELPQEGKFGFGGTRSKDLLCIIYNLTIIAQPAGLRIKYWKSPYLERVRKHQRGKTMMSFLCN